MSGDFWDDTEQGQGHLKAGLLGFNKSGKTFTATLLAAAVREVLKQDGPVAFFDTETGSVYVKELIHRLTGKKLLVKRSRSFQDLMKWGRRCVDEGVSVGIVDSITHPWRELCDSYLAELNEMRRKRGWNEQLKLEFQDWNVIKPRWAEWTDFYLNAPLSIIICGRAGWEYSMEKNEGGKRELTKVGVKMKTEGEFGFEPSLLVEMEAEQTLKPGSAVPEITRRATVLGDRFTVLDGKSIEFPSVELSKAYEAVKNFFMPHLVMLNPGHHSTVDTQARTEFGLTEDGRAAWEEEKRQRAILCEEIQAELTSAYPGQNAADKKTKVDLLKACFGTGSWTRVEGMRSGALRDGLVKLRQKLGTGPGDVNAYTAELLAKIEKATEAAVLDDIEKQAKNGTLTVEQLIEVSVALTTKRESFGSATSQEAV